MTSLDLATILKGEMQKQHEIVSVAKRRLAILTHYATRLRLGVHPEVVLAELDAAGETIELMESE